MCGRNTCTAFTAWAQNDNPAKAEDIRHYHNINTLCLSLCWCLMRVGGHLILSLQRNAIGAAISQRIIAISLWDQYSIKPRHLPNISDARNVQKVMCKQKKIPFEIRFCLRPCYQDTWIMTLSSTVKTLIFFFFFPHQEYILVWVCVGAEPPTSSWQKLRPVSMPIVYRGLHHDSYLALHWSHFDFSPLNRSPSQLRLAKQMKRKKEKEQKKPLIIFNAV